MKLHLPSFYKGFPYWIALIVFLASVWYLATSFQWSEIVALLLEAQLVWLLFGGSVTVVFYWGVRTLRWSLLLKQLGITIPYLELYMCNAVVLGFSIATPFQSGEVLKIELMRRHGHVDRLSGYSSFAVERALDLLSVLALASITSLLLITSIADRIPVFPMLMVVLAGLFVGWVIVWKTRWPGAVGRFQQSFRACIHDPVILVAAASLSLLGWCVAASGWYVCLLAIGIDTGYDMALTLTASITVLNLLSFVPGALGVSEVGISLFLQHLGWSASQAQAGALMVRAYGILVLALSLLHFALWRRGRFDNRCGRDAP